MRLNFKREASAKKKAKFLKYPFYSMIKLSMTGPELLSSNTERTVQAKQIIIHTLPTLDRDNVLGILGFGSFWLALKKNPGDIDLAIFANNDMVFLDNDRPKITKPLTDQFNLPVQFHVLTPYTPMVKHQLAEYRMYLKEYINLYGKAPTWL